MNHRAGALSVIFAVSALACGGPAHIEPNTPKERKYEPGAYAVDDESAKPAVGSVYTDAVAGYWEDTRAFRVGDIVVVTIDEHADASGNASTSLSKSTDKDVQVESMLGLIPALQDAYPELDPTQLIKLMGNHSFKGDGSTTREGELTARIAVRVKDEVANGDLYVEGTKVVMINNEEIHLYISGVVRPADIEQDNTVDSSRIADAQIEFTGNGDVAQTVERGWFTKFLDWINPI